MDSNKKVFVINGSGGVGKDTFVQLVNKYVPSRNYSSVEKVKDIAKLIGWDGRKTEKDRKFLSDLKLLTADYNDMPYKALVETVRNFMLCDQENRFLFLHIREPEEIKRITEEFGFIYSILIDGDIEQIKSNMADANVNNYDYDYVIKNKGTLNDLDNIACEYAEQWSKPYEK